MRVIGTAGHVDHGKSALVEALTGIHPDRLKEEREREMTIDLGFAWLSLPLGEAGEWEEVGIVDVPGHRDFIENMLAGVGGIDAALFVIAADEGVMPQTREHLAILDLLHIQGGVIALTKIDLVEDEEWLDLVESEVHSITAGTVLADAPMVRVSAKERIGLEELKAALAECLRVKPRRIDLGRPRLPVDRVFSIAGFGTVVTGTLLDGSLRLGDEVVIHPSEKKGRIRGLQSHKNKVEIAYPGSRTAINLSGVDKDEIMRGDVVTRPRDYRSTRRVDVQFNMLPGASDALRHNAWVKFFMGTAEVMARVRLLGADELPPGAQGWLQLELMHPVIAQRGDRYILRRPSPGETLGGGAVIDAHPPGRHKRFSMEVFHRLETLAEGHAAEVLHQALVAAQLASWSEVVARSNLEAGQAQEALAELVKEEKIINLDQLGGAPAQAYRPNDLVISHSYWQSLVQRALQVLADYHRANPLRVGMPREEFKSRMQRAVQGSAKLFNLLLDSLIREKHLEETGGRLRLPQHRIQFSAEQKKQVDALLAQFQRAPYTPPTLKECKALAGEEVVHALLDLEELVAMDAEVAFRKQDYLQMVAEIQALIRRQGSVSVAQVRDHFQTSRRYALALLEHLDSTGVTQRQGDVRILPRP